MAEAKKTFTCGYCGKAYDTIEERTACETRCAQAQQEEKAQDPRLGHVAYCTRCGYIWGGGYSFDTKDGYCGGCGGEIRVLDMTCEEYNQRLQELMAQDKGEYRYALSKELENQNRLNLKLYHQYIEPLGIVDTNCEEFLRNYERWTGNYDGPAHRRYDAEVAMWAREQNRPKCPTCGSKQVHKMSAMERGSSVLVFGLFSKDIGKTYKCDHCGYTW